MSALSDSQLQAYFASQKGFTDSDIEFFMTIHKQFVEEKVKQPVKASAKKIVVDEDFMDLYMADVFDYATRNTSPSAPVKPKTPAEKARETRLRNKMELEKKIREEVQAKIKAEELAKKAQKAEEKARKQAEKEENMRAMIEAQILAEKEAKKEATNAKRRETILRKKMEKEQLAILHAIHEPGAQ